MLKISLLKHLYYTNEDFVWLQGSLAICFKVDHPFNSFLKVLVTTGSDFSKPVVQINMPALTMAITGACTR